MAYEKQTWQTGDVITQEKLNHMEDGIENAYELPTVTETDNGKVLGVENGRFGLVNGGGGGGDLNGLKIVKLDPETMTYTPNDWDWRTEAAIVYELCDDYSNDKFETRLLTMVQDWYPELDDHVIGRYYEIFQADSSSDLLIRIRNYTIPRVGQYEVTEKMYRVAATVNN